jgi:hypothetical protein
LKTSLVNFTLGVLIILQFFKKMEKPKMFLDTNLFFLLLRVIKSFYRVKIIIYTVNLSTQ